jgi:hypothetical protein
MTALGLLCRKGGSALAFLRSAVWFPDLPPRPVASCASSNLAATTAVGLGFRPCHERHCALIWLGLHARKFWAA